MPLVIDAPDASFRLNYLFNRVEISHDFRQTWSIFYEDETHPLGALRGLTFHRGALFLVTDSGIYSSPADAPHFALVSPQRKGAEFVDIESYENMLYACTNDAIFQASSGSRWRLKYDGKACGHFFSLLHFQGKLFAACEKGIYVSSQEGKFWHPRFISKELGMFVALDGLGDKLFAQTDKGFYVSDDAAQHWRPLDNVRGPWTAAMGGTMLFEPRLKKREKNSEKIL